MTKPEGVQKTKERFCAQRKNAMMVKRQGGKRDLAGIKYGI